MAKFLIKIVSEDTSIFNARGDNTGDGSHGTDLIVEKDGVEILHRPSIKELAKFFQSELGADVVEIKSSYSEKWWTPSNCTCIKFPNGECSCYGNCLCHNG